MYDMVAFVLPNSSHNNFVSTSDVNRKCVDKEDDFRLIDA
jgi:hypothetical protein